MFGVCQIPSNFKIDEKRVYDKMVSGSFVYTDYFYLGSKSGHVDESISTKKFETGDRVEVEYDRDSGKVVVSNVTKGTEAISKIVIDKNQPVYVGVILHYVGEKVKLLQAECFI